MAKTHMVLLAALACAPLLSGGPGQETVVASQATPNWIWLGPATDNQEVVFSNLTLAEGGGGCEIAMTAKPNAQIAIVIRDPPFAVDFI